VSYESEVEPIRLGHVMDFTLPDEIIPPFLRADFTEPLELVFNDGYEQGIIDRPVEVIYREVEGLPKGSVKAVFDAYEELLDLGCVAMLGPYNTDNAIPTREEIERRFQVPAMSVSASDDWTGEWTFSLPNGSFSDETMFWAHMIKKAGHNTVGLLPERTLMGRSYREGFYRACRAEGLNIVAEQPITAKEQDVDDVVRKLYDAKPDAIVYGGFGFGMVRVNQALKALNWDPPRYMCTALEQGWITPSLWEAFQGWIGLEQYDEENPVGQAFYDRFEEVYGRRPKAYCSPPTYRDMATVFLHAFADAQPLSKRGVKEAMERIKMLPAASGSAGTRISFGKYDRMGWMGSGYLVARKLDPEFASTTHLVDRFH
jgi:branched-chain amino acid transport system substrate-binding protein